MNSWELELARIGELKIRSDASRKYISRSCIYLNGHTLPIKSSFKDVGITFSDTMSFNSYIRYY